jgi:hypothetical protein
MVEGDSLATFLVNKSKSRSHIDQGGVPAIQNGGGGHSDHISGEKLHNLIIIFPIPTQLHKKMGPAATPCNLVPNDQGGVRTIQNGQGGHCDQIFGEKLQRFKE